MAVKQRPLTSSHPCPCAAFLQVRAAGTALGTSVNFLLSFVIGQAFLPMLCAMKFGVFYFFAGESGGLYIVFVLVVCVVCVHAGRSGSGSKMTHGSTGSPCWKEGEQVCCGFVPDTASTGRYSQMIAS